MADPVNHPSHYAETKLVKATGHECIEYTRQMSFDQGNAFKYIWRSLDKENPMQDISKAEWYINDAWHEANSVVGTNVFCTVTRELERIEEMTHRQSPEDTLLCSQLSVLVAIAQGDWRSSLLELEIYKELVEALIVDGAEVDETEADDDDDEIELFDTGESETAQDSDPDNPALNDPHFEFVDNDERDSEIVSEAFESIVTPNLMKLIQKIDAMNNDQLERVLRSLDSLSYEAKYRVVGDYSPRRAYKGDAGLDIAVQKDTQIMPNETLYLPSGVEFDLPEGVAVHVITRSGTFRLGLEVIPTVVDRNYPHEISTIVKNKTDKPIIIEAGTMLAQAVLMPAMMFANEQESASERGSGKHGSSGLKSSN